MTIRALIEAVERGEFLMDVLPEHDVNAYSAFCGSLDAAKALHEALLPGWIARPQIGGSGAGVTVWHCTLEEWDSGYEIEANNMPSPARAWLLAILRAIGIEADDGNDVWREDFNGLLLSVKGSEE